MIGGPRSCAKYGGKGSGLTPEAEDLIARARLLLATAETLLHSTEFHALAARESYTAVLQAARAIILERTDRVAKTHRGTRTEIGRLAREDSRIDQTMAEYLAVGFDLRAHYDYGDGAPQEVTRQSAEAFVREAGRLIDHAHAYLSTLEPPPAA